MHRDSVRPNHLGKQDAEHKPIVCVNVATLLKVHNYFNIKGFYIKKKRVSIKFALRKTGNSKEELVVTISE